MSEQCTCKTEVKDKPCPVIGHPGKTDRSTRALILELAGALGEHGVGNEPVFFQDVETGKIFQVDSVQVERSEVGTTVFMRGESY